MQLFCIADQRVSIADGALSADRADDGVVAGDLAVLLHDPEAVPYQRVEPIDNLENAGNIIQRGVSVF